MKLLTSVVLVLGLAACQSTQEQVQEIDGSAVEDPQLKTVTAQARFEDWRRLWRVSAPLLVEGSPLCGDRVASYVGIRALTRQDLEGDLAGPLADFLHLTDRPSVVAVDPGSPAQVAGFRVGDRLLALGKSPIESGRDSDHLLRLIETEAVPGKAVTFKVGRDGGPDYLTLVPKPRCDFVVEIEETDELDLWADGKRIALSSGLIRAARTDERLASAVANGMARNTLNYRVPAAAAVAVAGITGFALDIGFLLLLQNTKGMFTRLAGNGALYVMRSAYEPEIDRRTTYFLARAGYDPETVIEVFDLFNESPFKTPDTIKNDPAYAGRLSDIQETIDEIRSKQNAGIPLVPDDLARSEAIGAAFAGTDYRN